LSDKLNESKLTLYQTDHYFSSITIVEYATKKQLLLLTLGLHFVDFRITWIHVKFWQEWEISMGKWRKIVAWLMDRYSMVNGEIYETFSIHCWPDSKCVGWMCLSLTTKEKRKKFFFVCNWWPQKEKRKKFFFFFTKKEEEKVIYVYLLPYHKRL
jgi:hypothetical protein